MITKIMGVSCKAHPCKPTLLQRNRDEPAQNLENTSKGLRIETRADQKWPIIYVGCCAQLENIVWVGAS
jgi:hypothetical protein